ncbi:MAG: hypothetical protein AB7Q23_17860 [Hyphomonadaceae bacterium]
MFDLPVEELQVDGVGDVRLSGLTFSQRLTLQKAAEGKQELFPALLLAAVVQTPKLPPEQWDSLGGINQDAFIKLLDAATKLAGLDRDDAEKKAET